MGVRKRTREIRTLLVVVCALVVAYVLATCSGQETPTKATALVEDCVNLLDLESHRIGSALIVSGMLYYSDLTRTRLSPSSIVAYDLQDWQQRWAVPGESYTPLVMDNRHLYHLDRLANILTAFSMKDGEMSWSVKLPTSEHWSEITTGDNLVFVAGGEQLHALSAETGEVVWTYIDAHGVVNRPNGPFSIGVKLDEYGALTFYEGTLYTQVCAYPSEHLLAECSLLALSATSGEVLWRFAFDIPLTPSEGVDVVATRPALDKSHVFFSTWGGQLFLLDRQTGELVWRRELWFPKAKPLLADGRALLTDSHVVIGIDVEENEIVWSVEIPNWSVVSPLRLGTEGEVLLIASISGERTLVAINPTNGVLIGRHDFVSEEVRGVITSFEVEADSAYVVTEQAVCKFNMQ